MLDMLDNSFLQFEMWQKDNNKALGHLFAGKIKKSFLLSIKKML